MLNSTVTLTQNLSQVSHYTLNVSIHYTSLPNWNFRIVSFSIALVLLFSIA